MLFESRFAKGGVLIRESNILTFLHLVQPLTIYIPSDALHDARVVRVSVMKSLSPADWIETAIDGRRFQFFLGRTCGSKPSRDEDVNRGHRVVLLTVQQCSPDDRLRDSVIHCRCLASNGTERNGAERTAQGKQCFHALGVVSVLPGPSPTPINLGERSLSDRLPVVDQFGERCPTPITGRDGVFVHDGVELLAGELWGQIVHCCLVRVVRMETCDHIGFSSLASGCRPSIFDWFGRILKTAVDSRCNSRDAT